MPQRRPADLLVPLVPVLLAAALLTGCEEEDPAPTPTPPTAVATASTGAQPRAGWRTEWFRTIAVDVPVGWGWSQGPLRSGGLLLRCPGGGDDGPYVGRPVPASDLCLVLPDEAPEHPYLWFDAPLEPGTEDLGGGWVRETVEVDGVRLTVASDDEDLRAGVLGSAREQRDCAPDLARVPTDRFDTTTEGPGTLLTAVVCGYRVLDEDRDAGPVLAYAAVPTEADVREVWERRDRAAGCTGSPTRTSEVVVVSTTTHDDLGAEDARPLHQDVVAWLSCRHEQVAAPVVDAGLRATLGTYIGPMG